MGIGRILNGELSTGDQVAYGKPDEPLKKGDYDNWSDDRDGNDEEWWWWWWMMMMMMMIDIINTCTIFLSSGKIGELFVFNNVGRDKVDSAKAGT